MSNQNDQNEPELTLQNCGCYKYDDPEIGIRGSNSVVNESFPDVTAAGACQACGGTYYADGSCKHSQTCPTCNGNGGWSTSSTLASILTVTLVNSYWTSCDTCNGAGQLYGEITYVSQEDVLPSNYNGLGGYGSLVRSAKDELDAVALNSLGLDEFAVVETCDFCGVQGSWVAQGAANGSNMGLPSAGDDLGSFTSSNYSTTKSHTVTYTRQAVPAVNLPLIRNTASASVRGTINVTSDYSVTFSKCKLYKKYGPCTFKCGHCGLEGIEPDERNRTKNCDVGEPPVGTLNCYEIY